MKDDSKLLITEATFGFVCFANLLVQNDKLLTTAATDDDQICYLVQPCMRTLTVKMFL